MSVDMSTCLWVVVGRAIISLRAYPALRFISTHSEPAAAANSLDLARRRHAVGDGRRVELLIEGRYEIGVSMT